MKTQYDHIGFVFGHPIDKFDTNTDDPPMLNDVVRRWMFEYDHRRTEKISISKEIKDEIIDNVATDLTNVWHNLSRPVRSDIEIRRIVRDTITNAQKYQKLHKHENNEKWINDQREKFSQICNISPQKLFGPQKKSNETITNTEANVAQISGILGKRKKEPKERLIEKYPPTPLAKKQDVEDDNLYDFDVEMADPGEDKTDFDIDMEEHDDNSDDETNVPQNCNVDFTEAIKFGRSRDMSVRDICGMINKTSKCHGITAECKKVSRHYVWTTIKRLDNEEVEKHNEKITGSKWLGVDGRTDTVPQLKGKPKKEEHVTIIDGITLEYKDHITPEAKLAEDGKVEYGAHSAPALAKGIYDFLERTKATDTVDGFNLDGCPTNVGGGNRQQGAIYYLEQKYLKRPLMISVGMLHLNELLLRHIATDICGFITGGPYDFKDEIGKIVKNLKDNLKPICNFDPIETNLPFDIPAKLLLPRDQRYMYDLLMAINKGPTDILFENDDFINRNPGEIAHARWLTLLNNNGRLLVQMTKPNDGELNEMGLNLEQYEKVKFLVNFGTKVYAPNFIKIKQYPDLKNGTQHFFDIIQLAKNVLLNKQPLFTVKNPMDIIKSVLTTNGFFVHPELILYWAIRDEKFRMQAVQMILKIRKRAKNKKVRKFQVPKQYINFDARNPWELAGDLDKLPKKFLHEPNLTKQFTNNELLKYANGEIELQFPFIKLHNVDIERYYS